MRPFLSHKETKMLWSYVKQNLIDLGFEEPNYLSDASALSIFCTATNKARRIISGVKPLIDIVEISFKRIGETTTPLSEGATDNPIIIDEAEVTALPGDIASYEGTDYTYDGTEWTAKGIVYFDLKAITGSFDRIEKIERYYNDDINDFADYDLLQGYKVALKANTDGTVIVSYVRKLDNITPDTPDDFDIQMDYEVEHLVPLLAGHYAWLDDDIQKATMYYNEYEQELNRIIQRIQEREQKQSQKMKIVGGFKWH